MRKFLPVLLALVLLATPAFAAPTRIEVPGGWYGENLPGGEYAVAVPASLQVVMHTGTIAMPPNTGLGPLYMRVSNVGGFKFAGQSHGSFETLEWVNGAWEHRAPACGVSPVIYDLTGLLHISDCSIGSQGWRQIADNGDLITGDATYSSATLKLFEYTTHGGISIGQGPESGCIAVRGADRRVLEPGDCRFVRFNMAGDRLAVTMVKLGEHKTVLLWFDIADLSGFPLDVPPVPVPVTPPPPPAPSGGMPNHKQDLINLRAQYGATLNQAQAGEMMGRLAFKLRGEGFGLLRKDGGNNCPVNGLSVRVSCDWILHAPTNTGCDVLGSGPDADNAGPSNPSWCDGDPSPDPSKFVAVTTDPGFSGGTTPTPTPAGPDLSPRIAALEARIAVLERVLGETDARLTGEIDTLVKEIDKIEAAPLDLTALGVAIDNALLQYEVNGKTRTDRLGLQHLVQLPITKRK